MTEKQKNNVSFCAVRKIWRLFFPKPSADELQRRKRQQDYEWLISQGVETEPDYVTLWGAKPIIAKHPQARIVLGKGVRIASRSEDNYAGINHPAILAAETPGSQIIIHEGVGISGSSIVAHDYIEIGKNTLLGANTNIYDNDFHALTIEGRRNNEPANHAPIHIGAECWLASNVTVLKGVTIGDRTTVGAMALVNKDLPSNVLAAGVPAKVIKKIE